MKRRMKILIWAVMCAVVLSSLAAVGVSALSPDVTADTWGSLELKALYVQSDADIYSELNADYFEYMWDGDVPEAGGYCQTCTVQMRGFAMSADGRYLYMGHLNGGTGVRGVSVFDTKTCAVTDLYYKYDGEAGHATTPFSYAKGIDADDRGYVYTGFAFSKNYNVVNLSIARQQEDGTLEEVYYGAVYEFGEPGDEGGIQVGVNGVEVEKVGDRYYCYVMVNYTHDALYCYDVTDPANPKLNKDFGTDGFIEFSAPSNTVAGSGCTLNEGYYMDVDEDGVIWLAFKSNESGKSGLMKIAPDGSACVDSVELKAPFSVEHAGGYLLCGVTDGSGIVVLDDSSYETVATIALTPDNGDRVVRMYIINDVLFVGASGESATRVNAVHAAPLTAAGQEFFDSLVANLNRSEEDTEASTETSDGTEAPTETSDATEAPTEAPDETEAPTDAGTEAPTEAPTEPVESGCGSALGFVTVVLLTVAAAVMMTKKYPNGLNANT